MFLILNIYFLLFSLDADSQITEAIITGNLEAAVELCLENDRKAEAIIIANSAGPELLKKTQNRYLTTSENYLSNVISALIANDWNQVLQQCTISSWKEALVAALTHSTNEFPQLCEQLGDRLKDQSKSDKSQLKNAILCYICAGSVEKLVDAWKEQTGDPDKLSIEQLHELVEIVMVLQRGALAQGRHIDLTGRVADLLDLYGRFLVSQGKLYSALTYLGDSNDERLVDLKERIYYAIGHKSLPQSQLQPHQQGPRGSFNMGRNVRSNSSQFGAPPVPQNTFNAPSLIQQWQPPANTAFNNFAPAPIPQSIAPPVGPPPPAIEQVAHPPRPASGSGNPSSMSRSKYVLDPSVRSNQQPTNAFYNQTPIYSGANNGPIMTPQQSVPQSTPYFQPQSGQPSLPPTNTPFFTPSQVPVQPPPNNFAPFVPQTNQPGLPPQPLNPSYDNNYINNQSQSFPEPPPPLFQREKNPTPPPGWNDPPVPTKARSRTTSMVSRFSLIFFNI